MKKLLSWLKNPTFRQDVLTNVLRGVQYETWIHWEINWRLCKIGFEETWYDGSHKVWYLGICTLYKGLSNDFYEQTKKQIAVDEDIPIYFQRKCRECNAKIPNNAKYELCSDCTTKTNNGNT